MKIKLTIGLLLVMAVTLLWRFETKSIDDDRFVTFVVNPKNQKLVLYWKNEKGITYGSLQNLKLWLEANNEELLFAMNGGMYQKDKSPQGLFIENRIIRSPLDTTSGGGNFYMKPNGIFYLTAYNKAIICKTEDFVGSDKVKYATQSGPMLVSDGNIHKGFEKNSANLNIRNGVGSLPNNQILFAMPKKEINFYEFATYFKNKGCKNALYLDGFVSRAYCPKTNWIQTDGNFGVIIGVTKKK